MIFRYGVVGVLGTGLHFGTLALLVEIFGLHPVASSVAGFVVSLAVSYVLNKNWTFGQKHAKAQGGQMAKYAAVSALGLLLNAAIMTATVEWLRWHYVWGQCAVIFVVPATNYALNRWWTFRIEEPS